MDWEYQGYIDEKQNTPFPKSPSLSDGPLAWMAYDFGKIKAQNEVKRKQEEDRRWREEAKRMMDEAKRKDEERLKSHVSTAHLYQPFYTPPTDNRKPFSEKEHFKNWPPGFLEKHPVQEPEIDLTIDQEFLNQRANLARRNDLIQLITYAVLFVGLAYLVNRFIL